MQHRQAQHGGRGGLWAVSGTVTLLVVVLPWLPLVCGDCWLIEGERGFVWLAICSQNQPPLESIPPHINSTVVDLRLNDNRIRAVLHAQLSRFQNLTYLNLTKNHIAYVEDGAFAALFNLQVLQMGYNRLRNLTEGMLRGLGKLQYLYLQANLIDSVSTNAFWECQELENVDLSLNRLQVLDGGTFVGLSRLSACEIYGNPWSCTCELIGFLRWLAAFPNRTLTAADRLACHSPPGFQGYSLLSADSMRPVGRNAFHALQTVCLDDDTTDRRRGPKTRLIGPPSVPGGGGGPGVGVKGGLGRCGPLEECASGAPPGLDEELVGGLGEVPPGSVAVSGASPVMRLKDLSSTLAGQTAVVSVHLPDPYRKMYVLVQYNNSFYTDIAPLRRAREELELQRLHPNAEYTYCVVSVRNALRVNETCLRIPTGPRAALQRPPRDPASATRSIVTLLATLLGMLLALGVVWHCVRQRQHHRHSNSSKGGRGRVEEGDDEEMRRHGTLKPGDPIRRSLSEVRYGGGAGVGGGLPEGGGAAPVPGGSCRVPPLMEAYQLQEEQEAQLDSPQQASSAPRGNYMEVRREEPLIPAPLLAPSDPDEDGQTALGQEPGPGSVAEICTIAKEVDRVNQIITNCIDALKADSSAPPGLATILGAPDVPPSISPSERRRCSPAMSTGGRRSEASPNYKGRSPKSRPPLQRHHSVEVPLRKKRGSASSGGSLRSPRSLRSIATVTPAAAILRAAAEAEAERVCSDRHRHSYTGAAGMLDPLAMPSARGPRLPSYSQLSSGERHYDIESPELRYWPAEGNSEEEGEEDESASEASSPGLTCTGAAVGLWERLLRFQRRRPRHQGDEYLAAGHALRHKVQFARDEDLHDILDYWKGVSAQHKA